FAPVMPLLDFSKIDDVIRAANNTRYGLAAYVFTNDLTVAWKMAEGLEAGIIGINDPVPATPQCPFGGMKESGVGRERAHEGRGGAGGVSGDEVRQLQAAGGVSLSEENLVADARRKSQPLSGVRPRGPDRTVSAVRSCTLPKVWLFALVRETPAGI